MNRSSAPDPGIPPEPPPGPPVDCDRARAALQAQLDGEVPPDAPAIEQHRAACPACRAWFEAARRMQEALRSRPLSLPPPGLTDRILQAALADRRSRQRLRLRLRVGLAVAASLLLAGVAAFIWLRPAGIEDAWAKLWSRPVEVRPEPPPEPPVGPKQGPEQSVPPLRDSFNEAKAAAVATMEWAAAEAADQTTGLLSMPNLTPATPDPMGSLEPAVASLGEAGQSVASGLQPVTSSARRALDMFLREVGPPEDGKGPGF